jgi:mono/diheme cytochrome c family protein
VDQNPYGRWLCATAFPCPRGPNGSDDAHRKFRTSERGAKSGGGAIAAVVIGALLGFPSVPSVADSGPQVKRGKAILAEKCGRCHAIDATGQSPLKLAPPMRDIYFRYGDQAMKVELAEGMVSKHREMPQIDFSREDVDAILSHLYAISIGK